MKLPTALIIIDCMPKGQWLTATDVQRLAARKYGNIHPSTISCALHRMASAVNVKILKKGDPHRLQYRLVSVGEDYLLRNIRQANKALLPAWMKKLAEPKKTYPDGFLMAEFNKLIREVRHA